MRRYGFITADVGPTDIFMHLDDVREGHIVRDGDSVEYCLVPCPRTGKERAKDVVKLPSWVPDGTIAAVASKRAHDADEPEAATDGQRRVAARRGVERPAGDEEAGQAAPAAATAATTRGVRRARARGSPAAGR